MRIDTSHSRRFAFALAPLLVISACTGSGQSVPLSQVEIDVPPELPAQANVNITNPTLTKVENTPVTAGGGMTLAWSDEFDGAQLDPAVWFFETGDGTQYGIPGWGNGELEYYVPDNAQLANGMLTITASDDGFGRFDYTSARINTRDRFAFNYDRIEARMRLPAGQGLWPAFWLLPQDDVYGTWAASGEIDIMEAINLEGSGGNRVLGTLHYGGQFPSNVFTGSNYTVPSSATTEFHEYALEWDGTEMRWYVDDVMYAMQNSWSTPSAAFPAPFDESFYMIFNVAVGGGLPGSPDASTVFPVAMDVDYVRVYSGIP